MLSELPKQHERSIKSDRLNDTNDFMLSRTDQTDSNELFDRRLGTRARPVSKRHNLHPQINRILFFSLRSPQSMIRIERII
jgi:hypothetical protein